MNLLKKIKSFFQKKCPYANDCPYYRKDAKTCQSPTAENGYCGQYREREKRT